MKSKNLAREYAKVYREVNKEDIRVYNRCYYALNKERSKKYRQENKDKIRAYQKAYREAHKKLAGKDA